MAKRVEIVNPEHFRESLAFAKRLGGESRNSFKHCLSVLNRIRRNNRLRGGLGSITIWPDWVKYSFAFKVENLHGGFILHGFEETYSVELVGSDKPHWSIHT